MGINITKPQSKLKSRLKLSLSLVVHIVFCFQLYVLWTFGTQSWTQYIALGSSILSCGFGTTVGHILLIYGNQRMPMFVDTVSGLICILPHTSHDHDDGRLYTCVSFWNQPLISDFLCSVSCPFHPFSSLL